MESLLRLRSMQEKKALGEMAKVLVQYHDLQKQCDENHSEIQQEFSRQIEAKESSLPKTEKTSMDKKPLNLGKILMSNYYIDRLEDEIRHAKSGIKKVQPQLEKEQKKVMLSRQKRRVLELLKEKKRLEYDRVLEKKENQDIIELNQIDTSYPTQFNSILSRMPLRNK